LTFSKKVKAIKVKTWIPEGSAITRACSRDDIIILILSKGFQIVFLKVNKFVFYFIFISISFEFTEVSRKSLDVEPSCLEIPPLRISLKFPNQGIPLNKIDKIDFCIIGTYANDFRILSLENGRIFSPIVTESVCKCYLFILE
jgi:hypothetical protein